MIFIGVDGGGTKTSLIAYQNGEPIAKARSGALNYNFIGVEAAVAHLLQGVDALGLPRASIAAVGIGDPSIDDAMPTDENSPSVQFTQSLTVALGCPVYLRSDAYMTLFGLTGGGKSAVLMLSGTGAMGIAENSAGQIMVAGGWGRLTGDEGSGYYIALRGIRAALQASDGIAPSTALTDAALRHFGADAPRELTSIFYREPAPDIASFALCVAECAEAKDPVAEGILMDAARYLAAYTSRLLRWSGADIVGVWGSVLCQNRRVRAEYERLLRIDFPVLRVTEPPISPERAAAMYAERAFDDEGSEGNERNERNE